jgi:DNA helicase-2/ATP-dependent DNA helicase PcrA
LISVAAAAVRAHLDHLEQQTTSSGTGGRSPTRALFLSFSRAAVAQILDRTTDILGPYRERVEVTTYHAFAWSLLQRFGSAVGVPDPVLASETEIKLFGSGSRIRYRDLVPLALWLCQVPAVAAHLRLRWSIIVCDEAQDTDDGQYQLLTSIRGPARLLLGDPHQCIYTNLPSVVGVGPQRLVTALTLPGAREILLPDVSHRDPTFVLPAAATAIRNRDFDHDAVTAAVASGRLQFRAGLDTEQEAQMVAAVVQDLRREGHTVGVFSHHIGSTTALSNRLLDLGVDHEIIGLPECLAAMEAQLAMVAFQPDHPEVQRA